MSARRQRRRAGSGALLAALIAVTSSSCQPARQTAPGAGQRPSTAATSPASSTLLLDERERRLALSMSPLPAPPADETNRVADDPRAVRLGHLLFFDPGLSGAGDISCATCHDPERAFTDGRPVGVGRGEGRRNTPTVIDSAHQRWFTWDGRADSAWAQATGPLEHPDEMAGSRVAIVRQLVGDPVLRAVYEDLFGPLPEVAGLPAAGRPVPAQPQHPHQRAWAGLDGDRRRQVDRVFVNVAKALAAYQRRLVSGPSAFDDFVSALRREDASAARSLSASAQRGLSLFLGRAGCRRCHFGPTLSDGEFHNTGAPPRRMADADDAGRYEGARLLLASPFHAAGEFSDDRDGARAATLRTLRQSPETWGEFRTPSLRHVALTAPYMHAGQLPDLRAVLRFYSTLEGALAVNHHGETVLTPFALSDAETDDLVAFLESLTGGAVPNAWRTPPSRP